MLADKTTAELRLFKAEDHFEMAGRGTIWTGPCPFRWNKDDGLEAWKGEWLISHPDADHTKIFTVIGVDSFCLQTIQEGSPVGILVKEIVRGDPTSGGAVTRREQINDAH